MTHIIALLAFFSATVTFAQTTFVTHRVTGYRTEVLVTGQSGEGALRDLHFLAQMRAHPQKIVEGKATAFDIGTFTKMGEGLRVGMETWNGQILVERSGHEAVISLSDELGWALYGLMETAGWQNSLGLYLVTSPSGNISCDMEWTPVEWVSCTIHLDHVEQ